MTRVIAVANQKGGVAKTTTVHTLGNALVERGRRILLVDLDPQACLTFSNGVDPETLDLSMHDVHAGPHHRRRSDRAGRVISTCCLRRSTSLAPRSICCRAPVASTCCGSRARRAAGGLRRRAHRLPAFLGILTINGLTAAHEVLIPLQCETLGQRGVGQLLETIEDVRSYTNASLGVRGVIATMFDSRTKLAQQMVTSVRENYDLTVLDPPVPKSVKVAEAPGRGRSVLTHAPSSKAASAYRSLAEQLAPAGARDDDVVTSRQAARSRHRPRRQARRVHCCRDGRARSVGAGQPEGRSKGAVLDGSAPDGHGRGRVRRVHGSLACHVGRPRCPLGQHLGVVPGSQASALDAMPVVPRSTTGARSTGYDRR